MNNRRIFYPVIKKSAIFAFFILYNSFLYAQEIVIFSFKDKFIDNSTPTTVIPCMAKAQRLASANRGNIIATYPSLPDSVKRCIEVATQTWESYLSNEDTVYLRFEFGNIENADIQTDVAYFSMKKEKNIFPVSLARHKKLTMGTVSIGYDALIINQNVLWDCGFSEKINSSSKNLTSALLRGIATSLGFGSSVKLKEDASIDFRYRYGYSPFDRQVHSPTKRLDEFQLLKDPNLYTFITGGNLYVCDGIDSDYQLYAPNPFAPYNSLQYFAKDGSLMSYGLKTGEKTLQVDSRTVRILRTIGWETKEPTTIKIIGEGIPETGITTAYTSHNFHIENNTGYTVTQPHWTFELPLNNGHNTVVAESGNMTFTTPAIRNEELYQRNIEGDIKGVVTFSGRVNGQEVIQRYNLSLELKPYIISISDLVYTRNLDRSIYYVDFTVEYCGSDHLHIAVEEDYISTIRNDYIYEPYRVHVHVGPLNDYHDAWIDIYVKNQYGEIVKTKELYKLTRSIFDENMDVKISNNVNFDYIEIYDLNGILIEKKFEKDNLPTLSEGFYILKYYKDKECCKTKKIIR